MCHRMHFESAFGAASLEALLDTRTHGWFSDLRFFIKRAFDYVWYVSFFFSKDFEHFIPLQSLPTR
jgi:hypothetical protein